jgi:hypothetical protein
MSYRLNLLSGLALAAVVAATSPDDPASAVDHAVGPRPAASATIAADVPRVTPLSVEWLRIKASAVTPAASSSPVPTIWTGLATEGEARARLEVDGYSAITALVKNDDGVWRGTAMRSGRRVAVGVDPRGHVGLTGPRD